MPDFLDFIKKGEFRITVCLSCRKKIWPPSSFCSFCLSKTKFRKIKNAGILREYVYSYKNLDYQETTFGIIDLSGILLIGSICDVPVYRGMKVKMTSCGISPDGKVFYHFAPSFEKQQYEQIK